MDANQTINYLRQQNNKFNKFNELKLLINSNNFNLTNDSFYQDLDANILVAQKQTFNHYGFNVAIIGAGATGLFLANILKSDYLIQNEYLETALDQAKKILNSLLNV